MKFKWTAESRARDSRLAWALGACAALVASAALVAGAMLLLKPAAPPDPPPSPTASPTNANPPFPRLATLYSKSRQDTEATQSAIARYQLYVADMVNWPAVSAADPALSQGQYYKQQNPGLIALMYFHSCIFSDTLDAARIFTVSGARYYVDPRWFLTYAGTTLSRDLPASATRVPVGDLGPFVVGDRVMLGGVGGQGRVELASIVGKSSDNGPGDLTVTRGTLSQAGKFDPVAHAAGDFVRPVAHAFGSGQWMVLNTTASAVTSDVNPEFGRQTWNQFVGAFLARKLADPAFASIDGYMLDNFVERPDQMVDTPERVDFHDDNTATGLPVVAWGAGMRDLAEHARASLPPALLLMGNNGGQDAAAYGRNLNGGMIEGLDAVGTSGMFGRSLADSLAFYRTWLELAAPPPIFVMNASPRAINVEQGAAAYQAMRYTLALTLTGDGYFVFDDFNIDNSHETAWWYDEYDNAGQGTGYLGMPLAPATEPLPGVYRRDFDRGISLANSNDSEMTVDLDGTFQKIGGAQVPSVNDGSLVTSVDLPARDGLILLRADL